MSKQSRIEAADPVEQLAGIDIGKIMSSKGPIVKCVLLRAAPSTCEKAKAKDSANEDATSSPKASSKASSNDVSTRDISSMSIKEIKSELSSYSVAVDASSFLEKGELIHALEEARVAKTASDSKVVTQDKNDDDGQRESMSRLGGVFS